MPRFLEEDTAEEEAITLGRQKCIPPGDCGGHCAATDNRISDLGRAGAWWRKTSVSGDRGGSETRGAYVHISAP